MIVNYFKFYILQLMLSASYSYLKDSDSQNIKKFKSKRQKLDNIRWNFLYIQYAMNILVIFNVSSFKKI